MVDYTLNIDTIRVDIVGPKEVGGMKVGTPNYPITVTHLPTGVQATVCASRQDMSRRIAMEMVEWGLSYTHRLEI